jgi:hypothetical protein
MTSERKATANKRNASLSTGPRTQGGKLRSSRNAFRHGLATSVTNDTSAAAHVDRLTRALAARSNDHWDLEEARILAEGYFDLARIRAVRTEVVAAGLSGGGASNLVNVVNGLEKVARYERRTRSKLRKGLKHFFETGS